MAIKRILLKKSFSIRSLSDVLINSKHLVILHGESFNRLSYVCKVLNDQGVNSLFLNKSNIFFKPYKAFLSGPTLLLHSNKLFLSSLEKFLENKDFGLFILLLKIEVFVSYDFYKFIYLPNGGKLNFLNHFSFFSFFPFLQRFFLFTILFFYSFFLRIFNFYLYSVLKIVDIANLRVEKIMK